MKDGDIIVWWRPSVVQGPGAWVGVIKSFSDPVLAVKGNGSVGLIGEIEDETAEQQERRRA